MSHGLCRECEEHLPFSILKATDGENWKVFRDNILGKDEAYRVMREEAAKQDPCTVWRVYPRNVADAILYGIRIGKKLEMKKRAARKRLPLLALPEHL